MLTIQQSVEFSKLRASRESRVIFESDHINSPWVGPPVVVEVADGGGLALDALAGVVVGREAQEDVLHRSHAVPFQQNLERDAGKLHYSNLWFQ